MTRRAILSSVLFSLALVAGPAPSRGETRGTGLGFVLGEPSGLAGKFWVGPTTALDAGLAWSTFDDRSDLHLQLDYVWHDFGLLKVDRGALPVYYGIGGRLALNERHDRVGVRFPVGLAYIFPGRRTDLFLEVAPTLDLSPDTNVDVAAGIGARYFFR